jgi:Ca2+:H+ antiporter
MNRFWRNFPLRTGHVSLNVLLVAVPVALVLASMHASALAVFAATSIAIIPLAGALGQSTEELAQHLGQRIGGLLNATLGNATELIIAIFALRSGHTEIVKASLSGSIIGNTLLVLGGAVLAGGIGRDKQSFSRRDAGVNTTMLFIAVVALVMPAVFDLTIFGHLAPTGRTVTNLSLATAVVLVVVYLLSLVYTLRPGRAHVPGAAPDSGERPERSVVSLLISLAIATVFIAWLSDILVAQIEVVKHTLGWSDLFIGVIVVATVGNAAEHSTAVLMAVRDKMDLSVTIAAGSSTQIALLVAPVLVFISWMIGAPMSLVFSPLEITGIALSVFILDMIASDGETTWFEGAELIAVYLILAIAFYFVPETRP